MVNIRTENIPLAFAGQVVQYGAGFLNIQDERIVIETENTPITFTRPTKGYTSPGGNPGQYTTQ